MARSSNPPRAYCDLLKLGLGSTWNSLLILQKCFRLAPVLVSFNQTKSDGCLHAWMAYDSKYTNLLKSVGERLALLLRYLLQFGQGL
jgi:hypothetical protein